MKDIDLRHVEYSGDSKSVGNQVAEAIKDAGYEHELSQAIKQFESGNVNVMEKAYDAMHDFAEGKGIKVKASKVVRIANAVVKEAKWMRQAKFQKIQKDSTNYDMLARVLSEGLKARGYGDNTVMADYIKRILAGEAVVEKN